MLQKTEVIAPKFIWTRWGTLVYCDDQGRLRHGDLLDVPRNVFISGDGQLHISGHGHEQVALAGGDGGPVTGLTRNGIFYAAEPDGGFVCSRKVFSVWEQMILLSPETVEILHSLRANDWGLRDQQLIAARDIVFETDFSLKFGPYRIDMTSPGSLVVSEWSGDHIAAIRFIYDGWRVAAARRFRPAIYFAVFGPDHIFDMLKLCLTSIVRFGDYKGHIFILSDRQPGLMQNYIPEELAERTVLSFRDVTDHAGMMMERFDISSLPIDAFQPVLCLDADMICDAPLLPLLVHCNSARSFFGSAEYGGAPLGLLDPATGQWFGRFLFEAAGESLDDVYALNGGAIAFSNKHDAAPIFNLIKLAFKSMQRMYPQFSACGEQPILGYFLQREALIDGRGLNQFIRFKYQNFRDNDPGTGFLHFNYGVGRNKLLEMSRYFEFLSLKGNLRVQNPEMTLKLNRSIPGQMTNNELARLAYLASQVPPNGIIVEVGCLYGLSSWHIAQHCQPGVTLFCIDPWERVSWIIGLVEGPMNAPEFGRKAFETFTSDCSNIVMVQGFSPDVAKGWNVPIDMYVEDAVHTNPELAQNILFWSSKIKSGGIVCGHDYGEQFPDVPHEAQNLAKHYNAQIELVDTFWSIRKP